MGLLHRSHSLKQFAFLSESEKGGLSALTPHRGSALYPNGPLLAFKSGAPTSASYSTLLLCSVLSPPPLFAVDTLVREAGVERKSKPGLVFNEIKKCEEVSCHKVNR